MIDIEKIEFEEQYNSDDHGTTTLYFIAPKEMLDGKYPEAESMEIMIEFPIGQPEVEYAEVMFSPTKDGSDYDWFHVELTDEDVAALIAKAPHSGEEIDHVFCNVRDKADDFYNSYDMVETSDGERTEKAMKQITTEDLRQMESQEGLVLQGCGGDLQEWVDGINDMLTKDGILKDGTKFDANAVCAFQHGDFTNLLLPFDSSVKLDMGKLAMWRLATHGQFGGTWLSDYVPNRLGGFVHEQEQPERVKPSCPLIGQNGNIYNLMGIAAGTLRDNGMEKEAKEMMDRITGGNCCSYEQALSIIAEYVVPTNILSERSPKRKKERNANER